MKVYISGPMSGMPENNFPLFREAALALRKREFEVVSPAELDEGFQSSEMTWADYICRDLKIIADMGIQGIVLLDDWYLSKGAKLEVIMGLLVNPDMKFFRYLDQRVVEIFRPSVVHILGAHLA
jgi:hypothetical protein